MGKHVIKFVKFVPDLPRPTPKPRPLDTWGPAVEALQKRPGQWAAVRIYNTRGTARSMASQLRNKPRFKGFEFAVRNNTLYMRWAGKHAQRRLDA